MSYGGTFLKAFQARQQAEADALRVVLAWNERLAGRARLVLFSPTLRAALLSRHPWLTVCCRSCETIAAIDLTVVRRPADMTIHEILPSLTCRRCPNSPPPAPVKLSGPQGMVHPPPQASPREIEAARVLAGALTAIARHPVGDNPIGSLHRMREIAERALDFVGIEWLRDNSDP